MRLLYICCFWWQLIQEKNKKVALARLENIDIFCLSRNSWIDIETIGERNRVFKNNKIIGKKSTITMKCTKLRK